MLWTGSFKAGLLAGHLYGYCVLCASQWMLIYRQSKMLIEIVKSTRKEYTGKSNQQGGIWFMNKDSQ